MGTYQTHPAVALPSGWMRKWSKEEINHLPIRKWEGPVHVVRNGSHLHGVITRLMERETVLGFDTETRPTFRKGMSYPPALVQLADGEAVYLIQLSQIPRLDPLWELLENKTIIKAGAGLQQDLQSLQELHPFKPSGFVDVGDVAREAGMGSHGLRNMTACMFGFRIGKGAQCSNWGAIRLRRKQIEYAATDAWISRALLIAFHQQGLVRGIRLNGQESARCLNEMNRKP
jgi:ribonuclease D